MNNILNNILVGRKTRGLEYPFEFSPNFVSHKTVKYYKVAEIKGANLHLPRKTFVSLSLQNKKYVEC